ncbi:MAG: tetratricopeptide repeat protein [Crocinitomicaceae bacterium]
MLEDDEQFNVELKKFEKMMDEGNSFYFEPDSLEDIIDHYIVKNKIKKATFAVDFALNLYPGLIFFELRKAQLFSTSGKLKESLLILQNLEKLEPDNAEVYITIASIFSQLRDHPKAIKYFEKAIEIERINGDFDQESHEILLDLALEYENNNDFLGAIKVLEQILELAPDNESAIYEIAFCYERIGDFDKCISYYERYIDDHPYSFTAWYNLGNIYFLKKNIEKALWAYDYSIIINENFSSAYFNMGNTFMQIDDFDQAIKSYRKCLEIDKEDDLALCYLGEALERKGELEDALKHYKLAIKYNPELADAYIGIGIVKDLMGKTSQAISYFQKAIQIQPQNDNYHHVLGEALFKLDRFAEAELELEKALQLNPKSADTVELLAKIKYSYNVIEAIDFLSQSELKESLSISAAMYKVKLLWEAGQQTESLTLFKNRLIENYNETLESITSQFPEHHLIKNFITIIKDHVK